MIAVCGVGCWFAFMAWRRRRMVRFWTSRGLPNPSLVRFEVTPDALVITQPQAVVRVAWSGVTEIMLSSRHWVFVANCLGYCLPRRFFESAEAERGFVASALAAMDAAAVARSARASAFARQG